jgi:hypothetical protein
MSEAKQRTKWLRHRLYCQIEALADAVKNDRPIPDFLIASFVGGLVGRLFVLCPEQMAKELMEPLAEAHRTRNAVCVRCDNAVEISRCHAPQCAACDQIDADNAADVEAELADPEDDE